jgi:hypothetical protein
VADRVIFQVFEANLKRVAFVQSFGKWSRDTILFIDDVGTIALEVQATKRVTEKQEKGKSREK